MILDILTIISNGAFLLPAVEAIRRGRWTRICIFLGIIVCSSMYHACNSFTDHCAGAPPATLRRMDFFFAQITIPLSALFIVRWPKEWYMAERLLILATGFGIFVSQIYFPDSLIIHLILAAFSLALIIAYWTVYAVQAAARGKKRWLPDYNWPYLTVALGLLAVACVLFVTEMEDHLFYWAVHSVWHVDAALAQFFLLQIWVGSKDEAARRNWPAAMDRRVQRRVEQRIK